jgi:putative ABC transport system ATP-binding protein
MIWTKNLTYQYAGSKPIVFPDLRVDAGKTLLICGESGCGKTTLLHLLAGLRLPTSGEVTIGEDKISGFSSSRLDQFRGQHIGIVYQQSYFVQSLSILDNLMVSPYADGKSRATEIAHRLRINEILDRYPNKLSVGQQQRASIARAVMNKPKILLADEPTSALDNKNCAQVIDLLSEEAKANNAALIIVTHDDRLRSEINNIVELETILK